MAPWLRFLEAYLVQALLRSPAFHRGVEKVAHRVHRFRHGLPPEQTGGTNIDKPGGESGFSKHFLDEVKTQLGYAEQKDGKQMENDNSVNARGQKSTEVEDEGSDSVWQNAKKNADQKPKAGFMQEYMDALRDQVRNQKDGR